MKVRPLGRTGLSVSALSLGTVSLGVDYGIAAPGDSGRPDEADAIRMVRTAVDRGVTLFDTAPAYGESERILGRAIGNDPRAVIATKLSTAVHDVQVRDAVGHRFSGAVLDSIQSSLRALKRDVVDVVQIHNATRAMLDDGGVTEALVDAQRRGLVRVIGASVYGTDAAMAVIRDGRYGVLQVAFSALDQRMVSDVLPAAAAAGVGVIVRSALLKGALTPKAQWLPESLAPLRTAATRACDLLAGGDWNRLPDAALRYCLSAPNIGSVLTGARTMRELEEGLAAEAAAPLPPAVMSQASALALDDERLVDPSQWPPL